MADDDKVSSLRSGETQPKTDGEAEPKASPPSPTAREDRPAPGATSGDGGSGGDTAGGTGNGDERKPAVHLDQLVKDEPSDSIKELLGPLQKVGYKLALFVFGLICTSTLAIFAVAFIFTKAAEPPGPLYYFDAASLERYQQAVDHYKQLGDIPLQRAKDLFQMIVITAFLPSFTAILGYIFGSRSSTQSNTEG